MYNPYALDGKHILVTGASSGLGRQVAISCAQMGARLTIVGRHEGRLAETFGLLEGDGHKSEMMDLCAIDQVNTFAGKLDSFDGVFNSIGYSKLMPVRLMTYEFLKHIMDANFMGTANLLHELLQQNKIQPNASIVLMSSVTGRAGLKGLAGYSASKGATNSFMRALAQEVYKKKIRVNTICAGSVDTPIWGSEGARPVFDRINELYPLGIGQPDDIANAAIFLMSEAGRWITGIELVMEGGLVHHV